MQVSSKWVQPTARSSEQLLSPQERVGVRENITGASSNGGNHHVCKWSLIYIYIPHSASYNIMTPTTSARRVSALVGHRKRPPVQVTAEPGQHQHHSNHHICHRVNALDGWRKTPPAQVTEGQDLHCRHWSAQCSKQM